MFGGNRFVIDCCVDWKLNACLLLKCFLFCCNTPSLFTLASFVAQSCLSLSNVYKCCLVHVRWSRLCLQGVWALIQGVVGSWRNSSQNSTIGLFVPVPVFVIVFYALCIACVCMCVVFYLFCCQASPRWKWLHLDLVPHQKMWIWRRRCIFCL